MVDGQFSNPTVLTSTNITCQNAEFPEYIGSEVNSDFDDLHYSDIEQSDLNDPPSPSIEAPSPHLHTPLMISQPLRHPPSTPGLRVECCPCCPYSSCCSFGGSWTNATQALLCQVLILMAMMMLPVSTLLHKHLHHYPNNNL